MVVKLAAEDFAVAVAVLIAGEYPLLPYWHSWIILIS